jgi:hypothetical protein
MTFVISEHNLPINFKRFNVYCNKNENGTRYWVNVRQELEKFKATYNNITHEVEFESEAHYNWFILRWS